MDLGIAGKSVFFTGGSKGMGREAAAMLAAEGCNVAIVARTKNDVDEAVESIKDAGGSAVGVSADITNPDDVERAVAEVSAAFGPPLIVVGRRSSTFRVTSPTSRTTSTTSSRSGATR